MSEPTQPRRAFGLRGPEVAVIGQGTWNLDGSDQAAAIATLRHGLDRGMTHIDTAEMYGNGEVETIIGEAIRGRRDELFLMSKVLPENASRDGTIAACERSLGRLGTDRLDCYLLHWRGQYELEDTIAGFEDLRAQGKIRSWGVSNFDVSDLEDAYAIAGAGRIACNQVLYHLGRRSIEHHVLPWCEDHGVALVGYSPFGHDSFPHPGTRQGQVLARIGSAHRATPRQIALAYLARKEPLFTIPKASSVGHVDENAGAGRVRLSAADIAQIEEAFPLGRPPRELPML